MTESDKIKLLLDQGEGSFWRQFVPHSLSQAQNRVEYVRAQRSEEEWLPHRQEIDRILHSHAARYKKSKYSPLNDSEHEQIDLDSPHAKRRRKESARRPMCRVIVLKFVSPRLQTAKSPLFWAILNLLIAIIVVWRVAKHYTEVLSKQHTEFINAGRIVGNYRDVIIPSHVSHMVDQERKGADGANFTFISWAGEYEFMSKPNYRICASAMPQLICQCDKAEVSAFVHLSWPMKL